MTPVLEDRHWVLRALSGKYGYLLCALVMLVISSPLITLNRACSLAIATLTSVTLVACIYAASPRRRSLILGGCLAAMDLVVGQVAALEGYRSLHGVQFVLGALVMLYVIGVLLQGILSDSRVTVDTLQAALCAYLLLGVMWNEVYSLVELIWPNSFHNTADPELVASGYKFFKAQSLHLLYFSFATLTTLGMEGVAPTSNTARMLVCAEAISGQVYITMLIARLVGMHIAEVQSARSVEGRE